MIIDIEQNLKLMYNKKMISIVENNAGLYSLIDSTGTGTWMLYLDFADTVITHKTGDTSNTTTIANAVNYDAFNGKMNLISNSSALLIDQTYELKDEINGIYYLINPNDNIWMLYVPVFDMLYLHETGKTLEGVFPTQADRNLWLPEGITLSGNNLLTQRTINIGSGVINVNVSDPEVSLVFSGETPTYINDDIDIDIEILSGVDNNIIDVCVEARYYTNVVSEYEHIDHQDIMLNNNIIEPNIEPTYMNNPLDKIILTVTYSNIFGEHTIIKTLTPHLLVPVGVVDITIIERSTPPVGFNLDLNIGRSLNDQNLTIDRVGMIEYGYITYLDSNGIVVGEENQPVVYNHNSASYGLPEMNSLISIEPFNRITNIRFSLGVTDLLGLSRTITTTYYIGLVELRLPDSNLILSNYYTNIPVNTTPSFDSLVFDDAYLPNSYNYVLCEIVDGNENCGDEISVLVGDELNLHQLDSGDYILKTIMTNPITHVDHITEHPFTILEPDFNILDINITPVLPHSPTTPLNELTPYSIENHFELNGNTIQSTSFEITDLNGDIISETFYENAVMMLDVDASTLIINGFSPLTAPNTYSFKIIYTLLDGRVFHRTRDINITKLPITIAFDQQTAVTQESSTRFTIQSEILYYGHETIDVFAIRVNELDGSFTELDLTSMNAVINTNTTLNNLTSIISISNVILSNNINYSIYVEVSGQKGETKISSYNFIGHRESTFIGKPNITNNQNNPLPMNTSEYVLCEPFMITNTFNSPEGIEYQSLSIQVESDGIDIYNSVVSLDDSLTTNANSTNEFSFNYVLDVDLNMELNKNIFEQLKYAIEESDGSNFIVTVRHTVKFENMTEINSQENFIFIKPYIKFNDLVLRDERLLGGAISTDDGVITDSDQIQLSTIFESNIVVDSNINTNQHLNIEAQLYINDGTMESVVEGFESIPFGKISDNIIATTAIHYQYLSNNQYIDSSTNVKLSNLKVLDDSSEYVFRVTMSYANNSCVELTNNSLEYRFVVSPESLIPELTKQTNLVYEDEPIRLTYNTNKVKYNSLTDLHVKLFDVSGTEVELTSYNIVYDDPCELSDPITSMWSNNKRSTIITIPGLPIGSYRVEVHASNEKNINYITRFCVFDVYEFETVIHADNIILSPSEDDIYTIPIQTTSNNDLVVECWLPIQSPTGCFGNTVVELKDDNFINGDKVTNRGIMLGELVVSTIGNKKQLINSSIDVSEIICQLQQIFTDEAGTQYECTLDGSIQTSYLDSSKSLVLSDGYMYSNDWMFTPFTVELRSYNQTTSECIKCWFDVSFNHGIVNFDINLDICYAQTYTTDKVYSFTKCGGYYYNGLLKPFNNNILSYTHYNKK